MTFTDRTALVTGAGRGIGKAIAETLAAQGVKLICVSKNPASCGGVADAINASGGTAVARAIDVADGPAVEAAAAELIKEFGKIDILVNNAGITRDGLLARMSEDDWNAVIQTNLTSCFHWTKAIGWPMCRNRWGRIVNISSVSGIMGNPGQANYSAAKAGMIGFSKTVAKEFARRNVTVNVVAPGFIQTDMTAELSEEVQKGVTDFIPMRRFGEPSDIANATAFLCAEESSYMTGQVLPLTAVWRCEASQPLVALHMSDQKTIEQRVKEIIVNQLNVNEEQITPEASFLDDLGADSLDTVELIMAFEEEFKEEIQGEIPESDAEKLQTVGHVTDYIKGKAGNS